MKKYVKPDLFYENFQLTSSVAKNCSTVVGPTTHSCAVDGENVPGFEPGRTLFASDYSGCQEPLDEIYCEYTDEGSLGIFHS